MKDRRKDPQRHGRQARRSGVPRLAWLRHSGRWWRTVRHIPPVFWRDHLLYRLRCRYYASALWGVADVLAREGLEEDQRARLLRVPPLLVRGDAANGRLIRAGQWPLAGVTLPQRALAAAARGTTRMDWHPRGSSPAWRQALHGFVWLNDLRAAGERDTARALVGDWLEQHGRWHALAWHPQPLSDRVVAWLNHADWLLEDLPDEERRVLLDSLRRQVRHLSHNCQTWQGGDVLIGNLKALVFAGVCLPGTEALLTPALADLLRQVSRQVPADGGHGSRSPAQHAQVLDDLLAVQALLKKRAGGAPAGLNQAIRRMGLALAHLRHADGRLALFHNGGVGEVAVLERCLAMAGVAEVTPPALLPDSGFARLERGPLVVLCDVGGVGLADNPCHAHAEALSFEVSVQAADGGGMRVLGNSGFADAQDRRRASLRGTAAHSTVTVDGDDSAEVWGAGRVGRRPEDVTADLKDTPGGDMSLTALHDGYRHRGVLHRRQWLLAADGSRLRGIDELAHDGAGWPWRRRTKRRLMAHFHVHPDVAVTLVDDQHARLTLPREMAGGGRQLMLRIQGGSRLTMREGWYAPEPGTGRTSQVLQVLITGGRQRSEMAWDLIRLLPPRR